jgi:flavin-dependent dehydrogenase
MPALHNLGLGSLLDGDTHIPCHGSVSVWGSEQPGYNDFFTDPAGRGFHLDRARFDADLRVAAQDRGVVMRDDWRFQKSESLGVCVRLWFARPGNDPVSVDADYVIDATGQPAAFARRLGVARNLYDEVISICGFADLPPETRQSNPTLLQTQPNGWWYGARLPGNRAIVSLCTDRETLKAEQLSDPGRWSRALHRAEWFCAQCQRHLGAAPVAPAKLHLKTAPSAILSNVVGPNWLAVGDAASSYDSMTSAGITKALLHARLAGEAVAHRLATGKDNALRSYQDQVFADFSEYLRVHQQHYRSEGRFRQNTFWRNRLR